MPLVRRAYVVAAPAWVAMLPLAAYAATRTHAAALTQAFAFVAYSVGSLVCHQKPERSFHLWAAQLPVCARCTGIYVGAAVAAVVAQTFKAASLVAQPFRAATQAGLKACATVSPRTTLIVAAIPTIVTLVFEWTTGVTPSNAVRFAAGVPLGLVVSWLVLQPSTGGGSPDSAEGQVN